MKKFAILSVSFLTIMSSAVLAPILPAVQNVYPNVGRLWIQSLITVPSLLVILMLPLVNRLTMSLKSQTIIGLLIYGIGGSFPIFPVPFWAMMASRAAIGVGLALIAGPAISLITDTYEQKERQSMIGYASATTNAGTVLSVLFAGWIVKYNWRLTFGIFLLGLVSFLLVWLFVPAMKRAMDTTQTVAKAPRNPLLYWGFVMTFVLTFTYFVLPTNMGFYVNQILKDPDPNATAALFAGISIFSFLVGLIYHRIHLGLKWQAALVFVGFAIGMLGFFMGQWVTTIIAIPVFGIALGIGLPAFNEWTALSSDDASRSKNIATNNAMIFAGQFVSPFAFSAIEGGFHLSQPQLFLSAAILAVVAMMPLLFLKKAPKEVA